MGRFLYRGLPYPCVGDIDASAKIEAPEKSSGACKVSGRNPWHCDNSLCDCGVITAGGWIIPPKRGSPPSCS